MNRIYSKNEYEILSKELSPEEIGCLGFCAGNHCSQESLDGCPCSIIARAEILIEEHQKNA